MMMDDDDEDEHTKSMELAEVDKLFAWSEDASVHDAKEDANWVRSFYPALCNFFWSLNAVCYI